MSNGEPRPTVSRPRILLIDDQTDVRRMISEGLAEFGFQVLEARTLAEASEKAADGPPFAAIVVDVALKDGFGESFARQIRRASPESRVAIITGYGETAMRERLSDDPGLAVLGKPLRLDALIQALQDLGVEPNP